MARCFAWVLTKLCRTPLFQDSALGQCFLSAAAASGAAAQAAAAANYSEATDEIRGRHGAAGSSGSSSGSSGINRGSDGSGLLLRLREFDAVRTAQHGAPLVAMSVADSKYAFQVSQRARIK